MAFAVQILLVVYVIAALLLMLHAVGSLILLLAYLRHRRRVRVSSPLSRPEMAVETRASGRTSPQTWPSVLFQLPVYNEKYVVTRLLDAVANLDYPRERLHIQLLDDSTDETSQIAAAHIAQLQRKGIQVVHVRRGSRQGYKAGALAYGLEIAPPEVEFVAVLDADFVPHPDFLRHAVTPLMEDPGLGMVQARWGHLNTFDSPLTLAQTLALDAHFVVEQAGRNFGGLLMNFNGTGGMWRIAAIRDAGGWKDNTLTEDLDLSYRAQLVGWRFRYLPDLVVPGELPPDIAAYKQQQARWAKGGTQCLKLLAPDLWRSPRLTWVQKFMATMHLAQYLAHPLMLLILLITPVMIVTGALEHVPLRVLGSIGIVPPFIFILSQHALYNDWRKRSLIGLPVLVILGIGMAWSNTRAVLSGLFNTNNREEFKRTPKYANAEQRAHARARTHNAYTLRFNPNIKWELLLAAYAIGSVALAVRFLPGYAPYVLFYAIGFCYVALLGVRDTLIAAQQARIPSPEIESVGDAAAIASRAPLTADVDREMDWESNRDANRDMNHDMNRDMNRVPVAYNVGREPEPMIGLRER